MKANYRITFYDGPEGNRSKNVDVFAESFDLQGNTFEVPQGYSINKTSDLSTKMVKNNNTNYTVFVSVNNFTDSNASINSRQVSGFRFLAEENFVSENNIPVTLYVCSSELE